MAAVKTRSSTRSPSKPDDRRLSEVARHVVTPSDVVSTGWPAVYRRIRAFGDVFDQWQQDIGALVFSKRASGEHAATVGGISLSIPRQVAKTFIVGRMMFALCTLYPDLTVIWTAHRTRTSDETFRKLSGLCKKPGISGHIEGKPREANGQQEIRFKTGSRILFGAREGGFGRGFDEVDALIFDEAQILTEKALEDMIASTNQSRWEPGALVFYMGTPPRPIDPGEAFTNRREEALKHRAGDTFGTPSVGDDAVYVECSADYGANPDDRKQWKKANPSYPLRTPLRSMLRLRRQLPSDDSWMREGLGVWDQAAAAGAPTIDVDHWGLLHIPDVEAPDGRLIVGVKFSPDGAYSALSVGVRPHEADVPVHVAPIRMASASEGIQWIVDWIAERDDGVTQVLVDGKQWAPLLVDALAERGIKSKRGIKTVTSQRVRVPSVGDVITAHTAFLDAVVNESLTHGDSPSLDEQIGDATQRKIGHQGGWGWQPISDTGTTVLLDATTLALYGAMTVTRGLRGGVKVH